MRDPKYRVVKIKYDRAALAPNPDNIYTEPYSNVWIRGKMLNMRIPSKYINNNTVMIPVEISPVSQIHKMVGILDNGLHVKFLRSAIVKMTMSQYLQLPDEISIHPMLIESLLIQLFH